MEMYSVTRIGEKMTIRYFYDFNEALEAYDRACKRKPMSNVDPLISLNKIVVNGLSEKETKIYRNYNHIKTDGEYRNVKNTAKKKKDGQMHPFGL